MATPAARQNIENSTADQRRYGRLELANGLSVLLVQLPEGKRAAAALAVKAGHFHDPPSAPGLAHFLEHLLFLGNGRYPAASAYADQVTASGGYHNAWTGTEHSNFYVEVPATEFSTMLDYFAALFHQPLFTQEWIDQERQSVEAEFRLHLKDDLRRLYDVQKTTGNPEHPFNRFSTGNARTLADKPGRRIQRLLQGFFKRHYRAGNMALVLTGPQSLAELQQLAETYFASLPAGEPQQQLPDVPLYLPDQLGQHLYVRPLKAANRLIITFPLPAIDADYCFKTTSFIAHLLGHEAPGSLCAWLKEKQWITELSAGGGMSGYNFKDFTLNLQLTQAGRDNRTTIVQACFTYIRLVAREGLQEDLYRERQQIVMLAYHYPETSQPVDLAAQLAINMLHYAPAHWVSGDFRMDGLNLAFAHKILARMVPERCRITHIHPDVQTEQHSIWYEVPFAMQPLSPRERETYRQDLSGTNFQLPEFNPFVPERLNPWPLEQPTQNWPQFYQMTANVQLWHLQEPRFREPKGHIYLHLSLPFANASARNYACSRIWCELALEHLSEHFYHAEVAGMHFNLYPQQSGITLHLGGFSDQQPALLQELLRKLTDFRATATGFAAMRDNLWQNWQGMHRNNPVNYLFALLHEQLQHGFYTSEQLAHSVTGLDHTHFQRLLPGLFRDAHSKMLVLGDWPATAAQHLAHYASTTLPLATKPQTKVSRGVTRLPNEPTQISFHSTHADHACAVFFQGQTTQLEEKALFLIFNQLIGGYFFNELRTRQQLGYLVGSSYVPMHGLPGLLFYVQSPGNPPDQLAAAIHNCLQPFLEQLTELPAEMWENARLQIIRKLRDPDSSLRTRAQRLWSGVMNNAADFELADKLAHALQKYDRVRFIKDAQRMFGTEAATMVLQTCGKDIV